MLGSHKGNENDVVIVNENDPQLREQQSQQSQDGRTDYGSENKRGRVEGYESTFFHLPQTAALTLTEDACLLA